MVRTCGLAGMSDFVPNTTASIYRAQGAANVYGETQDDNTTVAASGLPVGIKEGWGSTSENTTPQTWDRPTSLRSTLVEVFTIRFRPNTDVQEGDRVKDERNNLWFQVTDVVQQYSVAGYADVRVRATRIGDTSQPVNG